MAETLGKPTKGECQKQQGVSNVRDTRNIRNSIQGPNSNQNIENMRVDSSSSSRATAGRLGTPAKAGKEAAADTQETKGKLENSSLKMRYGLHAPKRS